MSDQIRELKRLYLNLDKKGQKAFRKWFNELQDIQFEPTVHYNEPAPEKKFDNQESV